MRNAAVLLSLALLGHALPSLARAGDTPQAVGCPGPGPVSSEVRAWQHKELGKFSQVGYFDIDGKPMAADAFLRDVTCHLHTFEMKQTMSKNGPQAIELHLLRDGGGNTVGFLQPAKR